MSNKISEFKCFHNTPFPKITAVFITMALIFLMNSCHNNESDDNTMTDTLLKNYMNSLCDFDISAMNENNLYKTDQYPDSESVKSACKIIAQKISWSVDNININGSTAIAQVKIILPNDVESICNSALNNSMMQIEQGSDKTPDELIRTEIKNYTDNAETREISAEISMSKVGNKWFISQSPDTASIISDIRTPVAAIYSIIEQ